jgi:hypothetical protein
VLCDISGGEKEAERRPSGRLAVPLDSTLTCGHFCPLTLPTGPANRGFLQHRDVHALLPRTDAMDHQEGTAVGGTEWQVWS